LVNVLVGGRLARAYFYTAFNLQKQEQIKFLHAIQMQGLRVKAVSLKKWGDVSQRRESTWRWSPT